MAIRGLLASLAMVTVLASSSAMGQWAGRMADDSSAGYARPMVAGQGAASAPYPGYYGIQATSYQADSEAPPAPVPPGVPPVPPPDVASSSPAPAPNGAVPPASPSAPGPNPWQWADPVPGAGPENSPCAADGGGYCCPPSWSFEEGARILARTRTRRTNVSYELVNTIPGVSDPVTTKALSFDAAAGYYATVAHYLGRDMNNRDQFVEFAYWGMNTWDATKNLGGVTMYLGPDNDENYVYGGSLQSYFNLSDHVYTEGERVIANGFNNVQSHQLYYTSDIHSFELNVRLDPRGRPDRLVLYPNGRWRRERQPGPHLSWLAGLRGMSIDETFDFSGSGHMEAYDPDTGSVVWRTTNSGRYEIRTHNDMFGFQVGGELMFRERFWDWGARFKLGPMVNFADQVSEITGFERDYYHDTTASVFRKVHRYEVAGVAEIGVEGSYKITPHLTFHAAYDWLFISNLALAPEQIDFNIAPDLAGYNNSHLNVNGHALYHGLTLGLEWLW